MIKKNNVIIATLAILAILFSGCSIMSDPLTIFKANEQVQAFLDQYPDADITVVKLTTDIIETENEFVNEICGISLEIKDHYKITMDDPATNLEIYGYIDMENQEIICLKKMGNEYKEAQEEITKNEQKVQETDKEQNKQQNQYQENNNCSSNVHLEGEKTNDGHIILEWTKNTCDDFKGYKVVWSQQTQDPKYPDNGYLKYITDKEDTVYEVPTDKFKDGKNWYRITTITENGKHHSNVLKFDNEKYEDEDKDEDNEYEYDEFELESEFDNNGHVILKWDKYEKDNFKYYKVVWSQQTDDITYPEDGYITAISDASTTEYKVPIDKFKEGTNYYRITIATSNYYSGDKDARAYSNPVKMKKNDDWECKFGDLECEDKDEEEQEEYDENKTLDIGEEESTTITLGGIEHSIEIGEIMFGYISSLTINDNTENNINIFDTIEIDNLYITPTDIIYSSRDAVKSYTSLTISNYETHMPTDDILCYTGKNSNEINTIYLFNISLLKTTTNTNYCSNDQTLIEYSCNEEDDNILKTTSNCQYACEDAHCLSEIEYGCETEPLSNGPLELIEGQTQTINLINTTYNITAISIGDEKVLLIVNEATRSVDGCEMDNINGLTVMINSITSSQSDDILGTTTISYE